jgi:hypothetical protein
VVSVSTATTSAVTKRQRSLDAITTVANDLDDDNGSNDQETDEDGDDHYDGSEDDGEGGDTDMDADADDDESCGFTDWPPGLFCRLLQSATMAIVDDSLSWEHYASLIQLLGLRTRPKNWNQKSQVEMHLETSAPPKVLAKNFDRLEPTERARVSSSPRDIR